MEDYKSKITLNAFAAAQCTKASNQKSIHCTQNGTDGKTGKKTLTSHCMQL